MNIAYMITAHTDPPQLSRLVKALYVDGATDFFILVDRKTDLLPFRNALEEVEEARANIHLLEKRCPVFWGGFSQVRGQELLLKAVMQSGKQFDRVVNLSGLDYPLWSNRQIMEEFEANPHKEYIAGINISRLGDQGQINKIVLYHLFRDHDWRLKTLSREILRKLGFRKPPCVWIDHKKSDVYMGGDWWSLTFACAAYVLKKMQEERKMRYYFKTAYAPSEIVVQTLVFNSSYGTQATLETGKYRGLATLTLLHHIDYSRTIKVFTETDYDELYKSGRMFCRKIVSGRSDALVKEIDHYRTKMS